ncbi:DUF547 domain-containing protein [Jiulongibacter sediminis]|uniref:DUF547 domain-containing protein n=1 Tax=Jiulongibacter sediminis TaxID=1605367 RepID=UPI000A8AC20A|nr:DUF547 domain-containing protein [Jiulongibacter sediminis]
MKKLIYLIVPLLLSACNAEQTQTEEKTENQTEQPAGEESKAVNIEEKEEGGYARESAWDELLKDHVDDKGMVDYGGMKKDREKLEGYLKEISANGPAKNWSKDEKMAYWINAYNAFTIKLILDNEGVSSIKDIGPAAQIPFVNTPWDIKFIEIEGKKYDLNNIEHGILRKDFKKDPRYHFALVCAAKSCPRLRNEAYTAKKLDKQLEEEAEVFLNNEEKNIINNNEVKISPLFKWYSKDFERKMGIAEWINTYSDDKVDKKMDKFSYTDYSWELNGSF